MALERRCRLFVSLLFICLFVLLSILWLIIFVLFVGLSKLSMVESVGQPGRGGVQLHGSCGHALESELRTPKLSGL